MEKSSLGKHLSSHVIKLRLCFACPLNVFLKLLLLRRRLFRLNRETVDWYKFSFLARSLLLLSLLVMTTSPLLLTTSGEFFGIQSKTLDCFGNLFFPNDIPDILVALNPRSFVDQ